MGGSIIERYPAGTAYFSQMKDEFEEIAAANELLSTKLLLMDNKQEVNRKFNHALKLWKNTPPSKYIIDYICTVTNFTFSYEVRTDLYKEIESYSEKGKLSDNSDNALTMVSEALCNYTNEVINRLTANGSWLKESCICHVQEYLDVDRVKNAVIHSDEKFIIYYLAPITSMSLEQINYFLCHVLKRKSIDFYNKAEFLLYVITQIKCSFSFAVFYELMDYYERLRDNNSKESIMDDFDNSMTMFVGYYAEDTFIDSLEGITITSPDDIYSNETIKKMLLWHTSLKKNHPSFAQTRFSELYAEINELYAQEIAEFKLFKLNGKQLDEQSVGETAKRGEYNISNKYDGSGLITIKYNSKKKLILQSDRDAFVSEGRFNRVNGSNLFAPCEDIIINAGSGIINVKIKCTSETPFQMVKVRQNGTVEIAERDSIKLMDKYAKLFTSCEIQNKPICIYFNILKNTGTILDYLYSYLDRNDMLNEWFYDKAFLNIDASLLDTPWFNDTKIPDNPIIVFNNVSENIQRNWILQLLFLKYVKEYDLESHTAKDINKDFIQSVQYEMGELRFDGISYGNPYDCLLSYLLLSDSPVDNLRLLYKEVDKYKNEKQDNTY